MQQGKDFNKPTRQLPARRIPHRQQQTEAITAKSTANMARGKGAKPTPKHVIAPVSTPTKSTPAPKPVDVLLLTDAAENIQILAKPTTYDWQVHNPLGALLSMLLIR